MTTALRPLIISLKPCYADLVFEGLKTVELRRRIASQIHDRHVFIYVSSPVKELRGGFRVGQVWEGSPDEVWNIVAELATVNRRDFDAYFQGQAVAYALEVTNVWEYQSPVGLSWLRDRFDDFVVPQSWRYAKTEEHELFREMERRPNEEGKNAVVAVGTS
jgi:predicted transcriptional regulator